MNDWHHAPIHWFDHHGAYSFTGSTYMKQHVFRSADRKDFLLDKIHEFARSYGWNLESWSVFSNHYHLIAVSPENPEGLRQMLNDLHSATGREINRADGAEGRQVWHQYWETALTYQRSYLARLNYVMQNPVKHGLVLRASDYRWCSAAWFQREANRSFYKAVTSMKIDRVNMIDDFDLE